MSAQSGATEPTGPEAVAAQTRAAETPGAERIGAGGDGIGAAAATRHRRVSAGRDRALGLLVTIPLAIACTVAVTVDLAAPAEAASLGKRPARSPSQPPASVSADAVRGGLAHAAPRPAPSQYTVVTGDTVSGIAGRFGLSTATVLARNGLGWSTRIFPGQVLSLADAAPVAAPAAAPAPVAPPAPAGHTVAAGETVSAIAAAAGVPVRAVLAANNLGWSSIIYPGQLLTIPGAASPPVAAVSVADVAPVVPAGAAGPAGSADPAAVAGSVTPLTDEMRANARVIIDTGRAAGVGDAALVVALVAAAQESGLRNVHYGDRDSLGLFQQRPQKGWGSPEQVLDPVRASQAFFGGAGNPNPGVTRGLLDIPGWENLTVTQAAQAVQLSAFPDYYAKWETSARAWLAELG